MRKSFPFAAKDDLSHPRTLHNVVRELRSVTDELNAQKQRQTGCKQISIDPRALSREKRSLREARGTQSWNRSLDSSIVDSSHASDGAPCSPLTDVFKSAKFDHWFLEDVGYTPIDALERRMGFTSQGLSLLHAIFHAMRKKTALFEDSQTKVVDLIRLAERVIKNHMEAFSSLTQMRTTYLLGMEVFNQRQEESGAQDSIVTIPLQAQPPLEQEPSAAGSVGISIDRSKKPPPGPVASKRYATPPLVPTVSSSLQVPARASRHLSPAGGEHSPTICSPRQRSRSNTSPSAVSKPPLQPQRRSRSTNPSTSVLPLTSDGAHQFDVLHSAHHFSGSLDRPPSSIKEEIEVDVD